MSLTIDAVLGLGSNSLHVCQNRYGGGLVAFISNDDHVERIINGYTGGDSYHEVLTNSFVYASWYPQACGDTVSEAIRALEKNLSYGPLSYTEDGGRYVLDMLLGRIGDSDGNLIHANVFPFLREHSVGPFSDEWVDNLSDLLDGFLKT
jgi:hypothetical protein